MAQLRGGEAPALGADLLVEGHEVLPHAGDDVGPAGADLRGLGLQVADRRSLLRLQRLQALADLGAPALELGDLLRERLGTLHHLDLEVLKLGLAPSQRDELVLQGGEVLGAARPGVEPRLVAGGPVPDELDVLL